MSDLPVELDAADLHDRNQDMLPYAVALEHALIMDADDTEIKALAFAIQYILDGNKIESAMSVAVICQQIIERWDARAHSQFISDLRSEF